ncbi:hypothetical protein NIE88_06790 [Sporolactobacillus shoreicorticis]|uniref:Uncharacterized protein n=1 Tax=Sporolactobacillus shoreicorticis TaxID=1923877 RepID=A0ABW5SA92_9BACL|nr:hypothetical protein [Sporolactobacillus shoreicorticis]MCO7125475.1 hypothetical protein [Sporolactobacillus shoreicorticis]
MIYRLEQRFELGPEQLIKRISKGTPVMIFAWIVAKRMKYLVVTEELVQLLWRHNKTSENKLQVTEYTRSVIRLRRQHIFLQHSF